MRYKHLGNSGLRVSEICLGAMSFGDAWGFGADAKETQRVIATYAEAGGNFIDTANKYHEGQSEEWVGAAIAAERERWVLATKYTLAMRPGDPNGAGNSRKNMVQAVNASLKRLGTDYVDLLWLHVWDFATPVEEVMRGLDDLVRQGKVLYVGISDAPAWVVAQANTLATLKGWSPFVGLQVEYSLIERSIERELLPMAQALGIGVTPWAPLGGGVLTGKYTKGGDIDTKRSEGNQRRLTERNLAIAKQVDAIAADLGVTSAQVATAWVRQQSPNIVPIVGARKVSQIEDVLGSAAVELSGEQLAKLDEVSRIELGFPHDFLSTPVIRGLVYGDTYERTVLPAGVPGRDGDAG
ncbi:MAG: aldo/keto reductase [Deltaproteobacteria bacterium]|nr:aldo/keto reductase [Deltaproteobacteria bacterium]